MNIPAVIIDDELNARQNLHNLCKRYCPHVQVRWEAHSLKSARQLMKECTPRLVFLDLMLGDGTGFELLEELDTVPFKVIFTTAHDQFALKAFEYHAADYLLKPIDPDALQKAVQHTQLLISNEQQHIQLKALGESHRKKQLDRLFIPNPKGFSIIPTQDIIYIQADGNYSYIYTEDQQHLATKPIKELSDLLSGTHFFRVHQSYLINLNSVTGFSREDGGFVLLKGGNRIQVARRRKALLIDLLKSR